jgi:sterol desaturase/sphingolipid hydroxylase (fatty acid hydroxylase superfamily)
LELANSVSNYAAGAASSLQWLFSSPASFLSPLPLAFALALGGIIVYGRQRRESGNPNLGGVLGALFPASAWKHKSTRHDLAIILINDGFLFFLPALGALIAFPLADYIAALSEGGAEPSAGSGLFEILTFSVYAALVWDFSASYSHYLKHKVPLLWEFHKVHHCAPVLTPLTAMRRHPIEVLAGAMITGTVSATAILVWILVFGVPGGSFQIAGAIAIVYVWRLLGYNLRHSHIWISYGPFWNRFLISPAHHQLHHSRDPRHHDCNFGHIFTFWDGLFGTLYTPVEGEAFEFGIEREENEKLMTLRALYLRPIRQAAMRFAPKSATRRAAAAE